MVPGEKYFVKGLQELFRSSYTEWEAADFDTNNTIGKTWEMHVKNCVRLSPCRPPKNMNSWVELNCERVGRNWAYWIGNEEEPQEILTSGTERGKPRANDGWSAEQAVKRDLEKQGYEVFDVSVGGYGCDLIASMKDKTIRVEVKSSTSHCYPELTAEEWRTAREFGERYYLAIIENFEDDQEEPSQIAYIRNPAAFPAKERTTKTYTIGRLDWRKTLDESIEWLPDQDTQRFASQDVWLPQSNPKMCDYCLSGELRFLDLQDGLDISTVYSEWGVISIMCCEECEKNWIGTIRLREDDPSEYEWSENEPCDLGDNCVLDIDGMDNIGQGQVLGYCRKCGNNRFFAFTEETYWERLK